MEYEISENLLLAVALIVSCFLVEGLINRYCRVSFEKTPSSTSWQATVIMILALTDSVFIEHSLAWTAELGITMALAGIAIRWAAHYQWVQALKNNQELIEAGPYYVIKNPMLLGLLCLLGGASLLANSILSLIFVVVFWTPIAIRQIKTEEVNLEESLGESYRKYGQCRYRLVPGVF